MIRIDVLLDVFRVCINDCLNLFILDLFNNMVTFRIADSSIDIPTFDMGHSGDIYLEFKTTLDNSVIIHSKGPSDFIKLALIGMILFNTLYFICLI